jgi:Zn-dependent protease
MVLDDIAVMKRSIRKAVVFFLLFLFRWRSIHGFQWLQPQRRHLTNSYRLRHRRPPKRQIDVTSDISHRALNEIFFPRIVVVSPLFQSISLQQQQQQQQLLLATGSNPSKDTSIELDDEEENLANKTQSELLAQVEALRVKAKAIRAEAQAMELALQETTLKRQRAKLTVVDDIIATLFSPKLSMSKIVSIKASNLQGNNTTIGMEVPTPVVVPDARVVADRLKNGRYYQDQVLAVVDRLYDLQARALGQVTSTTTVAATPQLPTSNNSVVEYNETASELYGDYLEILTQAASIVDEGTAVVLQDQIYSMAPSASLSTRTTSKSWTSDVSGGRLEFAIRSRIKELRQTQELNRNRLLAAEINRIAAENGNLKEYVRKTLGEEEDDQDIGNHNKALLYNITTTESTAVPMWVPSTLVPYINECNVSTISRTEVQMIEKDVLSRSRFFMTSSESVPGAALFRGNIRTNIMGKRGAAGDKSGTAVDNNIDTAEVFADIQRRMKATGLGDKVQLFFMHDLDAEPRMTGIQQQRAAIAAMEEPSKPVILALSKAVSPDESKLKKDWIQRDGKIACYVLTALSIFNYSVSMRALNTNFFDAIVKRRDLTALYSCIPIILGIIFLQSIHEVAHYVIAKKNEIQIGRPIPIPSLHFTTVPLFGCITPLRSFPKNRCAMLDFALSGPLTAITASLALVIGGILLTVRASPLQLAGFPVMPVANMKSSFLLGSILSWLAPKTMMLPLAQPVPMHPFFVVGASGLVTNGLNLLPIFRLDGGRACLAAMGQRQGAVISVFSILLILSMVLSGSFSIFITWTLLVALLQRRQEIPPRDDVTEVDGTRLTLWLLSFLLSALILAPFPGFSSLGI